MAVFIIHCLSESRQEVDSPIGNAKFLSEMAKCWEKKADFFSEPHDVPGRAILPHPLGEGELSPDGKANTRASEAE